jgi:hypothetical protein
VTTFLSPEWFDQAGERLVLAPSPSADIRSRIITLVVVGGPLDVPSALSLLVSAEGATLIPGECDDADVIIRLSFDDALALSSGTLESATALRDGRVKVAGDLAALTPLGPWLQVVLGGAEIQPLD